MQVGRDAREIVYPGKHAESTCSLAGIGGRGQTQRAGARGAQRRWGAVASGEQSLESVYQATTLRQPFALLSAAAAAPRQGVTHADM